MSTNTDYHYSSPFDVGSPSAPSAPSAPGDTTLTPDQYTMELLGYLSYLDFLDVTYLNTTDPAKQAFLLQQIEMCETFIGQAMVSGEIDNPDILQMAQIMGEAGNPQAQATAWTSLAYFQTYPGLAAWIKEHAILPDSGASPQDKEALAFAISMFYLNAQMYGPDMTDPNNTYFGLSGTDLSNLFSFQTTPDPNPFDPPTALSKSMANIIFLFLYQQNGSPQQGTPGWDTFVSQIKMFQSFLDPTVWAGYTYPGENPKPPGPGYLNNFFPTFSEIASEIEDGAGFQSPDYYLDNFYYLLNLERGQ